MEYEYPTADTAFKLLFIWKQRDRHFEALGEANAQNPASEDFGEDDKEVDMGDTATRNCVASVDDGCFPNDDNRFQTRAEEAQQLKFGYVPTGIRLFRSMHMKQKRSPTR